MLSGFEKIIIFYICLVDILMVKFMYHLYEFYEMLLDRRSGDLERLTGSDLLGCQKLVKVLSVK